MFKIQYFVITIFILLLTCIIYSNHFKNQFHFDDSHTIQNNIYIRNIKNIPLFYKDARTFSNLPSNQSYRPLVSTSLALDYWIGNGYDLFYFHLSSFTIFLLLGLLMLLFCFKIFYLSDSGKNYIPFFYVAIFSVAWYLFHPANAETINYIIARSDLQSTFFVLLALVLYMYSPAAKKTFIYLLPVAIGALAKPTAIMFAPLLFFYIVLFEERLSLFSLFKKKYFNRLLIIIKKTLPAFITCALLYLLVDKMTPSTWLSGGTSVLAYLITQPFVITHYFGIFFIPAGLSADTDWGLLETIYDIRFFAGVAFIIIMMYTAFACSAKIFLRPISYGILWFFICLIPTSSVIPFSEVLNYHRIFYPFVGLAMGCPWSLNLLVNKYQNRINCSAFKYGVVVVVILFLSVYSYNTYSRNKVWRTEESLWYDVTIKSPQNGRGLMNYGLVKMGMGDYHTAESYFTEAFKTLPYYFSLYINMGILKNAMGDKIAAETYFKQGIQYGENYPDAWFFYARFLCDYHRYSEAVPMLHKALDLSPAYMNARLLLMKSYEATAQWSKLDQAVQETLKIDPGNSETQQYVLAAKYRKTKIERLGDDIKSSPTAEKYLNLSLQYYEAGNYQQCILAAEESVKLKPDFAEAYNNLGSAYNQLHDYEKAVLMCQKALSLKSPFQLASNNLTNATNNLREVKKAQSIVEQQPSADNYLNLSLVYYSLGMYQQCIEACNKALDLKPSFDLAYNNICSSYNQLGKWDMAISAGEKGLTINPANALIQNNLAESRYKKALPK